MTKVHAPTEGSATTQKATKNFDYTKIAGRLRPVSWSNDSHPTGVVKPIYGVPTFPLITQAPLSKGQTFKNVNDPPYKDREPTANQSGRP